MGLDSISLVNFRNYKQKHFEFHDGVNVVVGPNTAGKTNLLEAINLLATGESFREGKVEEMVNWEGEVGHVVGIISPQIPNSKLQITNNNKIANSNDKNENIELQVTVTRGVVIGKRVAKRRLLVNGVGRSRDKFVGNLLVVCFRPEDMRIVEGSPGRRRNFLDEVMVQVDRDYARSLVSYTQGLKRRNRVLLMLREGRVNRTALAFWDQLVIKHGMILQDKRSQLADFFNSEYRIQRSEISEQRTINNKQNDDNKFFRSLQIQYQPSVMSEKRLKQYEMEEVAAGHTLVGPHRDDFIITEQNGWILRQSGNSLFARSAQDDTAGFKSVPAVSINTGRDLAIYGSRGEQRLGVLWLKIMAMEFIESRAGIRPLLLLDDIFSELDESNRQMVFDLCGKQQTVVTTAEPGFVKELKGEAIRL